VSSGELVNTAGSSDGDALEALSLRDLHAALEARDVAVSYKTLSEFTGTGDVGEQLHAGGGANRRTFPTAAVAVLAAFLPRYKEAKGRLPQAPEMLRAFLRSSSGELVNQKDTGAEGEAGAALVRVGSSVPDTLLREFTGTGEPESTAGELLGALRDLAAAVRAQTEAQPPPDDRALTRAQVAERLACKPANVSKYVANIPGRRGVYSEATVNRYLATGEPQRVRPGKK